MVAYNFNWMLVRNRWDAGGFLKWLEIELEELEKIEGFAYIISHHPPYHYLHQFGIRYKALMERYQHVVRFQTSAHTHDESFYVDKAFNSDEAVMWGQVSPSVTTFEGRNPAFTVIEWDEEYMVPVNIYTYMLNITEANLYPSKKPNWHLMHDQLNEYKIKDLSPNSM